LTGPFPTWVHGLPSLRLLNLGQNDISGEIPLVIGEQRNDDRHLLTNLREFVSDASHRYRQRLDLRAIKMFYRKHFQYIMKSNDLLWVNLNTPVHLLELQKIIDEYVKAEDNRLLTKAFQAMRREPLSMIENLKELQLVRGS
jgi:hypothetical protein